MIQKSTLLKGQTGELCRISHADSRMAWGIFILRWIFIRSTNSNFYISHHTVTTCKQNQTNHPSVDLKKILPIKSPARCRAAQMQSDEADREPNKLLLGLRWQRRLGHGITPSLHDTRVSPAARRVTERAPVSNWGPISRKPLCFIAVTFCREQHYQEESSRRKHVICSSV